MKTLFAIAIAGLFSLCSSFRITRLFSVRYDRRAMCTSTACRNWDSFICRNPWYSSRWSGALARTYDR